MFWLLLAIILEWLLYCSVILRTGCPIRFSVWWLSTKDPVNPEYLTLKEHWWKNHQKSPQYELLFFSAKSFSASVIILKLEFLSEKNSFNIFPKKSFIGNLLMIKVVIVVLLNFPNKRHTIFPIFKISFYIPMTFIF